MSLCIEILLLDGWKEVVEEARSEGQAETRYAIQLPLLFACEFRFRQDGSQRTRGVPEMP